MELVSLSVVERDGALGTVRLETRSDGGQLASHVYSGTLTTHLTTHLTTMNDGYLSVSVGVCPTGKQNKPTPAPSPFKR